MHILEENLKVEEGLRKKFVSMLTIFSIVSCATSFLGAFLELALKALLILCVLGYVGFEITGLAALLASADPNISLKDCPLFSALSCNSLSISVSGLPS